MSRPSGIIWLRLCSNHVTTHFTEVCKSSFERMIERGRQTEMQTDTSGIENPLLRKLQCKIDTFHTP